MPVTSCRASAVDEWQTRAQQSTLFVPSADRNSFCRRYAASLVERDDVMTPSESGPCSVAMLRSRAATQAMATSHPIDSHPSPLRRSGVVSRSFERW